MDIRDEIDRSFGAGPEQPPVAQLLTAGHRALRRRRLAVGAGALATVAVIGGTTWAATGAGGDRAGGPPVAASTSPTRAVDPTEPPTPTASSSPAPPRLVEDPRIDEATAVQLDADGLHLTPGLEVTRRLDDPWRVRAPGWSLAITYAWHGKTYWFAGYWDRRSGGASAQSPAEQDVSFRDWVAEQETIRGGGAGPSGADTGTTWPGRVDLQLVRLIGDSERLEPFGGVTMLQQRPHPDLPASWAGPEDRSAVAEVRSDGARYYVLARRTAGATPQYVTVSAADGGATLDDFLALARQRYAEGGGGLL